MITAKYTIQVRAPVLSIGSSHNVSSHEVSLSIGLPISVIKAVFFTFSLSFKGILHL